jgi:hypothetical protein
MIVELDELELVVIWFAMVNEQYKHDPDSQAWAKYEGTIRKIEKKLGKNWITPRPVFNIVK